MPDSLITKKALSEAMKELMAAKPLEKIKISDIVGLCNMNRQSFYYHFKDKYDLVNWIFFTEFYDTISQSENLYGWPVLEDLCSYLYDNKVFYRNALNITGQNSFSEYLGEVLKPLIRDHVSESFHDPESQEFFVTFLTDAIFCSISRWLQEGAQLSPEEFCRHIKDALRGIAEQIVKEDGNQSENHTK